MNPRWAILALVLAVPGVAAHAEPYQSDPASGMRLDKPPAFVEVAFTEPVYRDGSWIRVLDANGNRVDLDDLRVEGDARPVMSLSLPDELPDGAYRIAWQTYSVTDGHTVRGSIGFAVGGFTPPRDEVQDETRFDPVPSLARTFLYAGFAAGLGGVAFSLAMRRPMHTTMTMGGAAMGLGATAVIVWDTWAGTGLALTTYVASEGGTKMMARIYVLAGVTIGSALILRGVNPGMKASLPLLGGWLIAAYQVAEWGHITQQGPWGAWLEWSHLVAAATWIGGLALLVVSLKDPDADAFALGKRFGRLAGISVAVIAISGLMLTSRLLLPAYVDDPGRAWGDSWTWFLIVKVGAFFGMLAAAAINRYGYLAKRPPAWLARVVPLPGRDGFSRMVRWEAGTAVLALVAAGMLLSVSPPQVVDAEDPPVERTAQGDVYTGFLELTPAPKVGASHTFRFFVDDPAGDGPVTNNTCGRDDCLRARWSIDGDPGTEQESVAVPEGDGWWFVENVLFTQAGNATVSLDVQTGYVYLDVLEFAEFPVATAP